MRTSVVVVEDFFENPLAVRDYALRQRTYYPYQADADVASGRVRFSWMTSWFRPATRCPFKSSQALIEKLERATGDPIDRAHWNLGFPITSEGKADPARLDEPHSCLWNCSFHLKVSNRQELGEGVHNHVTDSWNSVGPDGWAGVLYLSESAALSGGLKLWRNRDPARNYDWMTRKEDWEQIDDLGNLFNRLILCRGNIPHSGAAGWGTNLEDGRIYQTFFFRVRPQPASAGLGVRLALEEAR